MKHLKPAILPLAVLAIIGGTVAYLVATGREYEDFVEEHGHHHEPPHGGTLILLGDHAAHIELLLEPDTGNLTAYLLDGHAEHPVRIKDESLAFELRTAESDAWQPVTLDAVASELTGETIGDTSKFVAEVDALRGQEAFGVRTPTFTIRGIPMAGVETTFPEGNE